MRVICPAILTGPPEMSCDLGLPVPSQPGQTALRRPRRQCLWRFQDPTTGRILVSNPGRFFHDIFVQRLSPNLKHASVHLHSGCGVRGNEWLAKPRLRSKNRSSSPRDQKAGSSKCNMQYMLPINHITPARILNLRHKINILQPFPLTNPEAWIGMCSLLYILPCCSALERIRTTDVCFVER
jgi:hypothetical protein